MKNKALIGALAAVSLVGILVMISGIGLSLGFRKVSVISFFSVIVLLIVLRFISRSMGSEADKED